MDEEAKRVRKIFREIVKNHRPFHALENTNRSKNGDLVVLETSGVPIFSRQGELLGYHGVDRNITRRKEMEKEREVLMQMISHDLRTPLTIIQGHADLLDYRLGKQDKASAASLEAILSATSQLCNMMDDLHQIVLNHQEAIPMQFVMINHVEFLPKLVRIIVASRDQDRVEVVLPHVLPTVRADQKVLKRVISNLLTNAIKYSDQDAKVILSAEADPEWVTISVTDHGKGISQEDLPFLFERFFRCRDSGNQLGAGLGLFIVKKLVEAHGGCVKAQSVAGQGSTFSFTLPVETWHEFGDTLT